MLIPPSERPRRGLRSRLKALLPSNLFGRAFLILALPMLFSQLFITHIFYDRHLSSLERNMASGMIGDLALLVNTYKTTAAAKGRDAALKETVALGSQLAVKVSFVDDPKLKVENGRGSKAFPDLYKGLEPRLMEPVSIKLLDEESAVRVRVGMDRGALDLKVNPKFLGSPTTTIFILWMVGSSLLLTMVATLFLRNQVRPIVQLAQVAEQLGLGQDVADFKPRGASEVRRAGRAFLVMAERIHRHVQSRTEMLAGISHDLRTPLTRMKLEMEMATMDAVTREAMAGDIEEMTRMIDGYLQFARGDAGELPEPIEMTLLLGDVVAGYQRARQAVTLVPAAPVVVMLRPQAMRRVLTNVIDNALRYGGGRAEVSLEQSATFLRVKVSDHGAGIPEAEQEMVFKPFTRLEPSRNSSTGGVGLGLSIARAIAQGHGGDVTLENRRDARGAVVGLEVTLRLPRAVQPVTAG
ncbi:MAG: ATP-binding protein [Pseudomonadota bacterium]